MRKVERPERNESKRGKLSGEQEERKGEAVKKVKRQLKKSEGS